MDIKKCADDYAVKHGEEGLCSETMISMTIKTDKLGLVKITNV